MRSLRYLRSRAVVILRDDIDTDQIVPARFLKGTERQGMAKALFADWRFDAAGAPRANFVLNTAQADGAQILISGDNFGCGSSREHAPWALLDHGFRVVLSPGFADIFRSNALRTGLLPVTAPVDFVRAAAAAVTARPTLEIAVDLENNSIAFGDRVQAFEIEPFARHCLLQGSSPFDYLLDRAQAYAAFDAAHPAPIDTTDFPTEPTA